jgi:hypothetical protein
MMLKVFNSWNKTPNKTCPIKLYLYIIIHKIVNIIWSLDNAITYYCQNVTFRI